MFVTSLLPTLEEGRTPTLQNRGQKSQSYIKIAPTKPFSGLALALLDAIFLLECLWFGLSPPPTPPLGAIFCERKKVLSSLERQQKANTPVLKN